MFDHIKTLPINAYARYVLQHLCNEFHVEKEDIINLISTEEYKKFFIRYDENGKWIGYAASCPDTPVQNAAYIYTWLLMQRRRAACINTFDDDKKWKKAYDIPIPYIPY